MSDESPDHLFDEASDELRTDVEDHLSDAEASLPKVDTVWETDADNIIGVLNQLKAALDGEGVHEPYTEARKWFLLGAEANAFDADVHDAFEDRFDAVGDAIERLGLASECVAELTPMFPELRAAIEEVGEPTDTDTEEDTDADETYDDGEQASEEKSDGGSVDSEPVRSEEPVDGGEDTESGQVEEWGTG
jgi:hypothetical protein